ncbi:iron chelate uptake ABC transporter family permease subunit, partial [Pseudomonas viridiflava]
GWLLLDCVDVLSRTLIAPEDLPIGISTALLGGLFFIFMMRRG